MIGSASHDDFVPPQGIGLVSAICFTIRDMPLSCGLGVRESILFGDGRASSLRITIGLRMKPFVRPILTL